MRCNRNLLIVACLMVQSSCCNAFGESQDEVIKKILSYEKQYETTVIKYTRTGYIEKEKKYVPFMGPLNYVFSSNGRFHRADSTWGDKGTRESKREISDGETYSRWNFSNRDKRGSASIEPALYISQRMLTSDLWRPFTFYGGNETDVSLSVESGDDGFIRLRWKGPKLGIDFEGIYTLSEDTLLPLKYIFLIRRGERVEINQVYTYEYEGHVLKKITRDFPEYEPKERLIYAITDVNVDPRFPDGHFDMTFRKGTDVDDAILKIGCPFGRLSHRRYTQERSEVGAILDSKPIKESTDEIFGPVTERAINIMGHRKDCFIDLDTGKLLSVTDDFRPHVEPGPRPWLEKRGIDAAIRTEKGLCGLWTVNTVVIPVSSERWDSITPAGCHRAFDKAKGVDPPIMSAEGKLPATFLFQTWDNRGILQIVEVQKDTKPRSIRVRYKLIEEGGEAEATHEMDLETILEKVRKAQRPCENMRIEWVRERSPGTGAMSPKMWKQTKQLGPENRRRLTRCPSSAVISGLRSRIEVRQETYYGKDVKPRKIMDKTYVFDGVEQRRLEKRTKGFRTRGTDGRIGLAEYNSSFLIELLFGDNPLLRGKRWLEQHEFKLELLASDAPGVYVVKLTEPEGHFYNLITVDGNRGYNIVRQQYTQASDGSVAYEYNFELKQHPDGTWFVSGREKRRFGEHWAKGGSVEEKIEVTNVRFDIPVPDEETFRLRFPEGTTLRDMTFDYRSSSELAVGSLSEPKHTQEDAKVTAILKEAAGETTAGKDEVFGQVLERTINSIEGRKDCFVDFDAARLTSVPEKFHLNMEPKKWLEDNSIDAKVETDEGLCGLWTYRTVVVPVSNERWDSITPAGCHRVLEKVKGIEPPIMSAEGELPATFLFQTWDNRGILQIVEVQKDSEPRSIKVRYKLIEEAAKPEAASEMDVETILEKVRKAQRPAENMRIEWVNEIGPGEIYRGRPAPPAENRIRLSKLKGSAVLSGVRYRIEARGEYYYTEDRENPSRISHSLEVFDGTEQRQWIAPVKGRRSSRTQIGSGAIRLSHVNYSRLSMHLFGDNPLKLSDSQLRKLGFRLTTVESEAPGTFVLKAVAPKGNSYDLFTIDGNRGYNIIKHEHFRSSDGRKLSENNLTLKQYSDGRWFVSKRELVRFSEDVSETNVTEKMTVTNVQFDYQSREKDLFKLQFPERTSIRDGTFGYSHVFMLGCLSEPSHKTEDAAVTAIMEQATGEEKTAGKNEVFGSATERIVNSIEQRKDAFIDFDAGKLTAVPDDFHLNQEWKKWLEENGVDARVETDDGLCGLWTFNTVVIPVSNKRWDSITPAACHRVFDKVKGVYPPIMSAEGTLPATFLFQTWDNRGILQILEVRKDTEPRSIKVRYKIIQKKAQIGKGKKQVG